MFIFICKVPPKIPKTPQIHVFLKLAEKKLHTDFRAIEPKLKIIFLDLEKQNNLHNMIFVFLASTYFTPIIINS